MHANILEIVATAVQFGTSVLRISPVRMGSLLDSEVTLANWSLVIAALAAIALTLPMLSTRIQLPKPTTLLPLYMWTFIHISNVYDVYRVENKHEEGKRQVPLIVGAFLAVGYLLLRSTETLTSTSDASARVSRRHDNPEKRDYRDEVVSDEPGA